MVILVKGNNRKEIILEALGLGLRGKLKSCKEPIIIKPNFLSYRNTYASTNVDTLVEILLFLKNEGKKNIVIAEGSDVVEKVFRNKLKYFPKYYNCTLFDINKDENNWVKIKIKSKNDLEYFVRVSKYVINSGTVISLALPKTHSTCEASLSVKNMIGVVHPEDRGLFHGLSPLESKIIRPYKYDNFLGDLFEKTKKFNKNNIKNIYEILENAEILAENISRLARIIAPDISIIDGFTGMQGNGPWHGNKIDLGVAIVSEDCYEADIICSYIMGFGKQVPRYLKYLGIKKEINEIEINGERINNCIKKFIKHRNFQLVDLINSNE